MRRPCTAAGGLLLAVLLLACPGVAAEAAQDVFDRGIVFSTHGQHEEALAAYERGIAIEPENALLWGAKGQALLSLGRHREAAAAYNRSLQLDPSQEYAREGERAALTALENTTAVSTTAPVTTPTPTTGLPWGFAVMTVAGGAGLAACGRRH